MPPPALPDWGEEQRIDGDRFDTMTRLLEHGTTRRSGIGAALGGLLGLSAGETLAKTQGKRGGPSAEGTCGDGEDARCTRAADCCTGICDKKAGARTGRCRCRKKGQSCTQTRNCCAGAGQDLSCKGGVCAATTCPGLGQACSTAKGTRCCPNVDPDVVCAGGLNPSQVCQDCSKPPTAEGAFCQDPPGNQCCGGKADCFSGVRVEDNQPGCYRTGVCRTGSNPCTSDGDCGGVLKCLHSSLVPCGCAGDTPTFCGTPCS